MRIKKTKELYFITDNSYGDRTSFIHTIEEVLRAGVGLIQLREKNTEGRELLALARRVKSLCDQYNVPLIIDDRLDVALLAGCGVHLGQSDLPIAEARRVLPPDTIIGATTKTVPQAMEAAAAGADYLGVGAIYQTKTKVKTIFTSVDTLKEICEQVNIPVFAIGGLNETNLEILRPASAIQGICVVSAIMQAADPYAKTLAIKQALKDLFD